MADDRDRGGNTTYIERGGGMGGVLLAIAAIAIIALIAFFVITQNRNDSVRTQAVSEAASSVAGSASQAARSVGDAAERVAPPAADR
jgi:hypothetical protein